MQEFNKVSTISNFIKQLLNTTYLPVLRTVLPGDYIIAGRQYLYHCEIINCTATGYILPYGDSSLSPKAEFVQIGEYRFGERNDKLCQNFQSNCEGYDSLTHERLGMYLRALRDMYYLNLMPLYNCFSNNALAGHHIFEDRIVKTSYNYHTKIYKVPIRFNTDYTICMDNVGITTFAPAFIRNEGLVYLNKTPIGDNIDVTNRLISLHNNQVVTSYGGLRFNAPIVLRFNNIPETKTIKRYLIREDLRHYLPVNLNSLSYFEALFDISYEYFETNIDRLYVKTGSDNLFRNAVSSDYPSEESEESSETVIPVFYLCKINPHDAGWVEDNGEDEMVVTSDTTIDFSKSYYLDCPTKEESYYTYTIEDVHCEMYDAIEDILYLLIQVPESFDSNIVILEGDYTNTASTKIYNQTDLRKLPENYLDKLFTSDIRLMRMNVEQKIPFSDTLVQFLLWNAISNLDTINMDFDRILAQLTDLYMSVDPTYYANYWYYRYRELINLYSKDNGVMYIDDNLGYVTTEIEALLNKNIPADREGLSALGANYGD